MSETNKDGAGMNTTGRARRDVVGGRPVEDIRRDFPVLQRHVAQAHDAPQNTYAYLDNAATTQKPTAVIEAIDTYYRESNANVHRAVHSLAAEATAAYEGARAKVGAFLNAASAGEIVFTRGTTEAINMVAASWTGAFLKEGDEIILTEMEHHSNLIPWQMAARAYGAVLRFVPFDSDGVLDLEAFRGLFSERTRFVAVTHMSNVFGTINDVERMAAVAHEHDVPILVDAAQSVPHMPVDVRAIDCDFLAFSGHKMCGPTGIGVLYGKEEYLERMPPFMGGGEMISAVWLDHAKWNDIPHKFEAGTPNIAGAVGLGRAVEYLESAGMDEIALYERKLTGYTLDALSSVGGLTLYGPATGRGGVLSFNLDGVHPHDVAQILDGDLIAVRAGHHCAHPVMRTLEVPATVRASLYFYNTREDIDRLVRGLEKTKGLFTNGV